jgi:2'-5' RNA ligase
MPRLFISISLPQNIRWMLQAVTEEYLPKLPRGAVGSPNEQYHFTLLFLGEVEEKFVPQVAEVMRQIAFSRKSFKISINRLVYGPTTMNPRMLWALADEASSATMGEIGGEIARGLRNRAIPFFAEANRDFTAHITLARWSGAEGVVLPELDERLDLSFMPIAVELVESVLGRGGAMHTVREIFEMGSDIIKK